ncbi:uncharacterized protein LOC129884254 [Solanum dulcamara]|uniref:uncharacterized protein LOC129884254 n=1 Tax=Solanum dulcamara TaxID=45834 RepID=UPI002485C726|nr:uncharacterized protein LOC129884254 [Solanum dulcamara]
MSSPKVSMAKDLGSLSSTSDKPSTAKKHKLSKKRRDAIKKKIDEKNHAEKCQISKLFDSTSLQQVGQSCQQFVLDDDQVGMHITPLQAHCIPTTPLYSADFTPEATNQLNYTLNTNNEIPLKVDEYAVCVSEDEDDSDNQPMQENNEDDVGVMERLKAFKNIHQVSLFAILEPFSDRTQIHHFKNQLNMDHAVTNPNDPEEKLGGAIYNMRKSFEFISIIEACGLQDLGFSGQKFTWYNQRGILSRIWKRLDRGMVNDKWLEVMPQTPITHLPTVGSDHCPLLLEMTEHNYHHIKYFKFLNCWTDHPAFMETVSNCWNSPTEGNPMWCFHQKMKRLFTTLSRWSKLHFGDIYTKVKEYEDKARQAEDELISANSKECRANLHAINAEYIRFLKLEESMLKQKTQLHWFKEGDMNSKYFYAVIRGRRRKLYIHRIQDEEGTWLQGEEDIARAACDHFQHIFTGEEQHIQEDVLQCVPKLVSDAQNKNLQALPTLEELRIVIFSMNPNSAVGSDGMNGKFFQECWEIIKEDLFRLLCLRLATILPNLISLNQSGFVKNRSIFENIMLAQEIIHQIKKPNVGGNVVIKLDMTKAYDRVSWSYNCLVLRRMGFGEGFIDMTWFFYSTRGLKQGDPLSPALFIIGAEVLSRLMNNLHHHTHYHGFLMAKGGPQINHLSFADDVIIFSSGRSQTLQLIMDTLHTYESTSGQLINRDKSHFMVPSNAFNSTVRRIKRVTGFKKMTSPITYLGCPLYIGRQKINYYSDLITKVVTKITGCQAKLLSYGGRVTLIKHVIQALPIYLLSASSPSATTIKQIQRITANFFWGWKNDKRKYHWSSWKNLSYPYDEGGIGVRQVSDVAKSFQYKQLWVFRTKNTLWGEFLKAKYCQRSNPITKKWDTGQSLIWKHLMKNKHNVEPHIQWQIQSGFCLFWWDNWLGIGPLAQFSTHNCRLNNTQVSSFMNNGHWNANLLIQQAPPQFVPSILATHINQQPLKQDQPCWTLNNYGEFSCSSTWDIIRDKRHRNRINSNIWHQHIPFKCSFLVRRALRRKLPTNDKLISFGHPLSVLLLLQTWPRHHRPYLCCRSLCQEYLEWPHNRRDLVLLVKQCYQDTKVTPVCWTKTPDHLVKLNTDGSALSNPGNIGGGGILRNASSELIFAYAIPLGAGTYNQAEIKVAIFGLSWCLHLGYS